MSMRGLLGGIVLGVGLLLGSSAAMAQDVADQIQSRLAQARTGLQSRSGGVLGLFGYNMVPDGSTNALTVNRGSFNSGEGSPTLTLGQLGFGFTVSESLPIFLESYLGYARYDPRAYITGGEEARRLPLRWNNVAATLGVGYDIRLAENLWLRPILNGSLGYAAPDSSLFGSFINYRTGVDISPLTDRHMNVYGLGGSLVLAYYDYTPARNIDVELRYTQLRIQSFGDTPSGIGGSSTARTLGLWTRLRWPTGWEAFGRPVRWVIDGSGSAYLGDQREALGFNWSVKIGGGIEFDVGRHEFGLMGINLNRVRLIGRYFYGDHGVTGTSFGIGMSF
jgi:opacity protein-like surface antigen